MCRQFGFVSPKNHPSRPCFRASFPCFFPVFCLFLQNEPNPFFSITNSCRDSCEFFRWVRLAETLFYIKPFPLDRRQRCSSGRLGRPTAVLSQHIRLIAVPLGCDCGSALPVATGLPFAAFFPTPFQTTIAPIPPPNRPVQHKYQLSIPIPSAVAALVVRGPFRFRPRLFTLAVCGRVAIIARRTTKPPA